ncbi:MAG: hypothetical protein QXK37_06085 [Candidatus Woesearchaeota archaeon]
MEDEFEILEEIEAKKAKQRKNLKNIINKQKLTKFDLDEVMIEEASMEI